jgi:N-acetylglucosaminyldiphosphoundecaprenol N-acetyl-beta-D-mannosaminyltransferase
MIAKVTQGFETVSFLGIDVQPTTIPDLMTLVAAAIEQQEKCVIANHNMHSVYLFHREKELRDFYSGVQWTHIDGMPIVALARLYGHRVRRDQRVTYIDWTGPLMAGAAENGWRVFYLGSSPGVAEEGAKRLRQTYPELQIQTIHGYFDTNLQSQENDRVLNAIEAYKPHILMVGMGMPRQEYWIQQNLKRLCANVILPAGAAIDYVAGAVPTPPRWAGRLGLEWAFRLTAEPQRLWRRYLVEPWSILGVVAQDFLGRQSNFEA